jgi:hypothetical protein
MSMPISRRTFTAGAAGSIVTLLSSGAIAVPLPLLRAAAQGSDLASLGLPTMDITVTGTAFEGIPAETAAGRYLINLTVNEDVTDGGQVDFVSPAPGHTVDEFLGLIGGGATPQASPEAMGAEASPVAEGGEEEGPLPTFVYQAHFAGGAACLPGTTQAVVDLPPGEWIAWGDDPGVPQPPVTFTVTGEMPADLPEPEADVMATLIDFAITIDGALTAGDHIIRVENQGAQPHFLLLFKGPDELTNEMVTQLIEAEMSGGTPPALPFNPDTDLMPVAYTPTQSLGTVQWAKLSLEAGTYMAACFFPTAGEGLPHAFHGMHTVFTVS